LRIKYETIGFMGLNKGVLLPF